MGIFDDKESRKKIQYLEEERTKIWKRIIALENENKNLKSQIIASASDSAKDAAQSSKRAAEYRNKSELRLHEASEKVGEITAKLEEANKILENIQITNGNINAIKVKADQIDTSYQASYQALKEKIDHLTEFIEDYPELDEKLSEITSFINDIESNVNKSKSGLSAINLKRKEIEEFYEELFGYNDVDEDGEEIRVDGLKHHLTDGFGDLADNIKKTEDRVAKIKTEYEEQFKDFEKIINHNMNR